METIGSIKNGVITLEYYNQGYIYKNFEAFNNKTKEICYIPELCSSEKIKTIENSATYNYNDFLELCQGMYNTEKNIKNWCDKNNVTPHMIALDLFESVDWQHPETLLNEWIDNGAFTE